MESFIIIGYSLLFLFAVFLIIKKAVSEGIDSSKEIKLLKKERIALKKQLKMESQSDQENCLFNKKV